VQNNYLRGWTRELTRLFIDPNIFSPPSRGIIRNPLDPLPKGSFLEKNERRKLDPYFGFSRKFVSPPCRGKSGSGKDDPSSRPPLNKEPGINTEPPPFLPAPKAPPSARPGTRLFFFGFQPTTARSWNQQHIIFLRSCGLWSVRLRFRFDPPFSKTEVDQ